MTVEPSVSVDELRAAGLDVHHVVRGGTIVSGTVSASAVLGLAALRGVIRVESDGQMYALDEEAPRGDP